MLVLATSIPVIVAREEAVKTVKTIKAGKNNKDSKYPETNLVRVLYIQNPITF